jgi:hypothetical protein
MSQLPDSSEHRVVGEPILRVFANFHMQIDNENSYSGFEVERAYIGYKLTIRKNLEIKINLDIGSPDDISEYSRIRRYAYFKNAALKYRGKWFTTSFGLIDMTHFKLQEEVWGHRYIERSFADRFRFGPSADLGWNFIAKPTKYLSVDISVSNGEGYNNLQRDNTLKFGVGTTLLPLEGLSVRIYADIMEKDVIESTLAGFIGYRHRDIASIGLEYNYKFNDSYEEGFDRYGYSLYGSYSFWGDLEFFARYDWLGSNMPDDDEIPWNLENDGSSILAGIQYQPLEQFKVALNYRDWFPYAANLSNETFIYLNLEYKY